MYAGFLNGRQVTKGHSTKIAAQVQAIECAYIVSTPKGRRGIDGFKIRKVKRAKLMASQPELMGEI